MIGMRFYLILSVLLLFALADAKSDREAITFYGNSVQDLNKRYVKYPNKFYQNVGFVLLKNIFETSLNLTAMKFRLNKKNNPLNMQIVVQIDDSIGFSINAAPLVLLSENFAILELSLFF